MHNRWNLAVWRHDPWISERSFNMFASSVHECRSSATRSFRHNLHASLPDVFEQLKGSPCQRMLQVSSSRNMPAVGIELLLGCVGTSVLNELQYVKQKRFCRTSNLMVVVLTRCALPFIIHSMDRKR
jgi:hypothetical protein